MSNEQADKQARYLLRKLGKAVRENDMIRESDRILVGVSGGKDSLSLLDLLVRYLRMSPVKYTIVAGHVRGDAIGVTKPAPENLVEWVSSLGLALHERDIALPEDEPIPMGCDRCAWNRRKTLFEMAEELNCNVLALGHNLDDFAETALLNLLQNGKLETMALTSDYFGKFRLIRPLALIQAQNIARFARVSELPVAQSACPLATTSARNRARDIIRQLAPEFKHVRENLAKAAKARETTGSREVVSLDIPVSRL